MAMACSLAPSNESVEEVEQLEQDGAPEGSQQHPEFGRNQGHNTENDH